MQINGKRAYKLPDKNVVCFYWEPRKNEAKSAVGGAFVFDQVLMAEIYSPGFTKQVHRPEIEIKFADGTIRARNSGYREQDTGRDITWREHFGEALIAWEKDQEAPDNGTPLEAWAKLDVGQIASLRAAGVFSLEMLADLPDSRLGIVMGGRTLRDQAIAFLEQAKGNAQNDRLIAENNELKERMARMEAQLAEIKAADAEKEAGEPQKRGPGRPPKQTAA